jgi:hypothetical protein
MGEYTEYVAIVLPMIGLISGMVGKPIVDRLKNSYWLRRWGLKGRKRIQLVAALICAGLATGLLASAGVLDWKVAPVTLILAWLVAEARAKRDEARGGK